MSAFLICTKLKALGEGAENMNKNRERMLMAVRVRATKKHVLRARSKATLFAGKALLVAVPLQAFAVQYDAQKGDVFINGITATDVSFDSVLLEQRSDTDLYLYSDIDYNDSGFAIWRDVTIQGDPLSTFPTITLKSVESQSDLRDSGITRELSLDKLRVNNAFFDSEAILKFAGNNIDIELDSGSVKFDSYFHPNLVSSGSLLINANTGADNGLYEFFTDDPVTIDTTINVASGAKLTYGTDSNYSGSAPSQRLTYDGNFALNLDNSEFELHLWKLQATQGTANLDNNSRLYVYGNEALISLANINILNGSTFEAGINNNTSEITGTAFLHDGNIVLGRSSDLEIKTLKLQGNNRLEGAIGSSGDDIKISTITLADNSATSAVFEHIEPEIDQLTVENNLAITFGAGTVGAIHNLNFNGGVMTIGETIEVDQSIDTSGGGSLIINGTLEVKGTADLEIGNSTAVTLNANHALVIKDGGTLSGNGLVGAAGSGIFFNGPDKQGVLSPGGSGSIDSIITDSRVEFYELQLFKNAATLDSVASIFDAGIFQVDVDIDDNTGNALADKLVYGAGDVEIGQLKTIEVSAIPGDKSSDYFNYDAGTDTTTGKTFSIIEAQNAAVVGTIHDYDRDFTKRIVEGANVPIYVDFTAEVDKTGAKPALVLTAKEADAVSIRSHSSLRNHRNAAQALTQILQTVAPVQTGNANNPAPPSPATQALVAAVNSITNATATTANTLHPEAFASQLGIQLEQADDIANTVLRHAGQHNAGQGLSSFKADFIATNNRAAKGLWVDGAYMQGDVDGRDGLGSYDYDITNFLVGGTFLSRENYSLGSFFGFGSQELEEHDTVDFQIDSSSLFAGVYGEYQLDAHYVVSGSLGFGTMDNKSKRALSLGATQEVAEAEYDASLGFLNVQAARPVELDTQHSLTPFVNLAYIEARQDAFQEKNAPVLGLSVEKAKTSANILGLGVEHESKLLADDQLMLSSFIRLDHDFNADEHEIDATHLAGTGPVFNYTAQHRGENVVTAGVSGYYELKDGMFLGAGLMGSKSKHAKESGVSLSYEWTW